MPNNYGKVIVLCRHPGVLLNYGLLLSQLQYYNVSLCSSIEDCLNSFKNIGSVSFLIYDNFTFDKQNIKEVIRLNNESEIKKFIFIEDLVPGARASVYSWARSHDIALQQMIKFPISLLKLKASLNLKSRPDDHLLDQL